MVSLGFIYTKKKKTLTIKTQAKHIQSFALRIYIIKSIRQSNSHTIPRMLFLPLIYIAYEKLWEWKPFGKTFWSLNSSCEWVDCTTWISKMLKNWNNTCLSHSQGFAPWQSLPICIRWKSPICNCVFQLAFNYKHSWKQQLQFRIFFCNYTPKKLTSTTQKWNYSWKQHSHVNAIVIIVVDHFSCKGHLPL